MERLLILACSQRKKASRERLPAIERYDGPAFRVLRKYLRQRQLPPKILILSAKYGLIDAETSIAYYDFRMTETTAEKLRPAVLARLRQVARTGRIHSVGLCLGREYMHAVRGFEAQLLADTAVDIIGGGLGLRLTRLREWLNRAGPTIAAESRGRLGKPLAAAPDGQK